MSAPEFQAIVVARSGAPRQDEEALARELAERRGRGWALLRLVPLSPRRVLAVFQREG